MGRGACEGEVESLNGQHVFHTHNYRGSGHDDTVEGMREELELGIDLIGADASLTSLL